jgi:hypothetical protein
VPFLNDPMLDKLGRLLDALGIGFTEDWLYRYLLFGKMRLGRLKATAGGVQVSELPWGQFFRTCACTPPNKSHADPSNSMAATSVRGSRGSASSP